MHILAREGRRPETILKAERGVASRPAVRIRAPGGSGDRAQNRQGWSAERPVPVCPGRPRLANVVRAFTESATTKDTASRRSARPSLGAEETEAKADKENPGAATRGGNEETALFDMVNRN
jgi:hypothetical protein